MKILCKNSCVFENKHFSFFHFSFSFHIGNLLNDMNAELNFILETNGNKVNFLDLTIYKRDQTVETDIFL